MGVSISGRRAAFAVCKEARAAFALALEALTACDFGVNFEGAVQLDTVTGLNHLRPGHFFAPDAGLLKLQR